MLSSTSKEITWVHSHIKLCYWSTAVVGLFWGGSKCQAHCLNFDRWKIVIKISHEFLYKEIHMTFWRSFCLDQNSNILTRILTLPQNSPTTAVESSLIDSSVSKLIKCSKIWFFNLWTFKKFSHVLMCPDWNWQWQITFRTCNHFKFQRVRVTMWLKKGELKWSQKRMLGVVQADNYRR